MAYPDSANYTSKVTKTFTRYGSKTVTCKFNLASYYDPQANKTKVVLYTTVSNELPGQYNWYGGVKLDGTVRLAYNAVYPANISGKTWTAEIANGDDGVPSKASYSVTWKKGGDYKVEMGSLFGYFDTRTVVNAPEGFNTSGASGTLYVYTPTFYTLTIDADNGSPVTTESHAAGYVKSLPTPTKTGYTFAGWSVSGAGAVSDSAFTYGEGDATITAQWTTNSYTLSISQGTGTAVSVEKAGVSLSDGDTISYGDVLDISIDADTGYNIATHTVNGANWEDGSYTVNGPVSVVSTATLQVYPLSMTVSDGGIVANALRTASPLGGAIGNVGNGDPLYYGDVIKVSYEVASGYQIQTATVNGVDISDDEEETVTVSEPLIVVLTVKVGALAYINNEAYQIFIGNGVSWEQYQAYIGDGVSFVAY